MNIRDVNANTYRPDQLRSGSSSDTSGVSAESGARSDTDAAKAKDRVEISPSARSAAAADAQKARDLAGARKALLGIPPLSEERVAEILDRINDGSYSQPEVLQKVAERVTHELTGG